MQSLPELLEMQQTMQSLSNGTSRLHFFGHDLWLIFPLGTTNDTIKSISDVLWSTPIRFDSGIFGFIENTAGKILLSTNSIES